MEEYENLSGQSGVLRYALDSNAISVEFKDGKVHTYNYASAGAVNIETMKALARAGLGLNTFINQRVRKNYVH